MENLEQNLSEKDSKLITLESDCNELKLQIEGGKDADGEQIED